MEPVIRARGLWKNYGGLEAVRGIDFEVPRGVCFGFLGPNGAGKTSVMKMIYGAAAITAGELRVLDLDASRDIRSIKGRLGVVPQEENLEDSLTVRENLVVYARYFGIGGSEAASRIEELLRFADLVEKGDQPAIVLSGGMKRRLLVIRGLVNRPDILLLDEPTTGLDPQARRHLWEKIRAQRKEGVTILLTTHYLDEAEQLCDELVILDQGRIIERGEPRALIRRHLPREVIEAFVPAEERDRLHEAFAGRMRAERTADALLLYTDDGEALLAEIGRLGVHPESILLRRATLEDVFLKITGRALRG